MKFDDIKKISAWELLKLLERKTKSNTLLIKENTEIIQSILRGVLPLIDGRFNMAEIQAKNNTLLKQNSEYLKLHNNLLTFLKSLQNENDSDIYIKPNEGTEYRIDSSQTAHNFEECLRQTVKGLIEFNLQHPYYKSKDFRDKLIEYYTSIEDYEKCALLVKEI